MFLSSSGKSFIRLTRIPISFSLCFILYFFLLYSHLLQLFSQFSPFTHIESLVDIFTVVILIVLFLSPFVTLFILKEKNLDSLCSIGMEADEVGGHKDGHHNQEPNDQDRNSSSLHKHSDDCYD